MFRVVGPLIILAMQFFLYRRTIRWLKETGKPGVFHFIGAGLFLVFNGAALYVMIDRPAMLDMPDWFLYSGVYPYFIWHGATFFIGLIVLLSFLIGLPFRATVSLTRSVPPLRRKLLRLQSVPGYQKFNESRRRFLRNGMYALTGTSFAGSAYGMLIERGTPEVTEANIVIDSLDPNLDGFTIGLISDVHSSVHMSREEMTKYVSLMNGLRTDLVVVDGDFVNSAVDEVYPFAEAFSNLSAPYGVFGVMGNHDYYNADPDRVAREVTDCGIQLIFDGKTIIEKDGQPAFYLLGVDDIGRGVSASDRIRTALGKAPLPIPRILLCHRPYFLEEASALGIDLVLSGHTHGGQIVLGRVGDTVLAPASLASKYIWGTYREGNTWMYVSRGIGTVGIPVRINCPPEVTRIVLRSSRTGASRVNPGPSGIRPV
jgi:predicted MPP superfamily phosphohydrolase